MSERKMLVDLVMGAAAVAAARNYACFLELTQDALDGPLRDADRLGDLPDANVRIAGDA
jgi:hypothetical protein